MAHAQRRPPPTPQARAAALEANVRRGAEAREKVKATYAEHPDWRIEDIARAIGYSCTYVQQIMHEIGYDRKASRVRMLGIARSRQDKLLDAIVIEASRLTGATPAALQDRAAALDHARRAVYIVANDKGVNYRRIAARFNRDASNIRDIAIRGRHHYEQGVLDARTVWLIEELGELV